MRRTMNRSVRLMLAAVSVGVLFEGCSLSSIGSYLRHYNYGGSVLNMSPTDYAFLTSGYQGPGADPNIDPACTYPPYCSQTGVTDPFVPANP